MAFLVEETLGNFDFRILRVSISLGTKFQRNRLVLIRAQASLRKGVVASAISSIIGKLYGEVGLGLLILA